MSTLSGFFPARQFPYSVKARSRSNAEYWGPRVAALVVLVWAAGSVVDFRYALKILNFLGFGIAVVGILRPALGVLGVGVLCTLDALSRVFLMRDGAWRYNSFNYLLLFMAIVALPITIRLVDRHSRILQVFIMLLIFGLLLSPERRIGMVHTMNALGTFGILVYFLRARLDPKVFLWMGLVNGVLAAIGGGIFYLQMNRLPYINPNAWVFFPLTALFSIIVAFRFAKERSCEQILLILFTSLNVVWIFLSGSRGGMFISVCCLGFIVHSSIQRQGKHIVALSLLAGLGVGAAVLTSFEELRTHAMQRVMKLFDDELSMESRTSGRSDLAVAGWYMFLDNPLGVGTGGFAPEFANREFDFTDKNLQAHSAWIKTLAENGILGIIFLIAYVTSFAVEGWHKRKEGHFQLGTLVTIALAVAFCSTEFQGKGLWFLTAAVTTLLHYPPRPVRRREAFQRPREVHS